MKMQNMKFAGILLVIIALVALMIPVVSMADPPDDGTLIIHKYVMPDKSTATQDGTGAAITGDITAQPGDGDAVALDGVTFKIYKVSLSASDPYPASGAITLTNLSDPTVGFTDSAGNAYTVTAVPAPNAALTTTGVTTAGGGIASTGVIPQGIYLVVEQGGNPDVTSPSDPFIVAVPMTDPSGSGWLNPVNVYPKNEMLTITKAESVEAVNVGDPVTYTITPAVPSDLAKTTSYRITDTLDPALDFVNVSSVKAATTKAGLAAATDLNASYYSVAPTSAQAGGGTVTVSFTSTGLKYLADNGIRFLQITLNTTVNSAILDAAHGCVVENDAQIKFTNSYNEAKEVDSNKVYIHTVKISVLKEDGTTHTLLDGAKFKIASSSSNAANGYFLRQDPVTGNICDYNTTQWQTLGAAADYTVETGVPTAGSGTATFAGLKDYTGMATKVNQTYYLVETAAPANYNMLTSPIPVALDTTTALTPAVGNNYTVTVTVDNNKGFTLPKTGAAGVAIFTVVGIALIGFAIVLIVNMKKKKETTDNQII